MLATSKKRKFKEHPPDAANTSGASNRDALLSRSSTRTAYNTTAFQCCSTTLSSIQSTATAEERGNFDSLTNAPSNNISQEETREGESACLPLLGADINTVSAPSTSADLRSNSGSRLVSMLTAFIRPRILAAVERYAEVHGLSPQTKNQRINEDGKDTADTVFRLQLAAVDDMHSAPTNQDLTIAWDVFFDVPEAHLPLFRVCCTLSAPDISPFHPKKTKNETGSSAMDATGDHAISVQLNHPHEPSETANVWSHFKAHAIGRTIRVTGEAKGNDDDCSSAKGRKVPPGTMTIEPATQLKVFSDVLAAEIFRNNRR